MYAQQGVEDLFICLLCCYFLTGHPGGCLSSLLESGVKCSKHPCWRCKEALLQVGKQHESLGENKHAEGLFVNE